MPGGMFTPQPMGQGNQLDPYKFVQGFQKANPYHEDGVKWMNQQMHNLFPNLPDSWSLSDPLGYKENVAAPIKGWMGEMSEKLFPSSAPTTQESLDTIGLGDLGPLADTASVPGLGAVKGFMQMRSNEPWKTAAGMGANPNDFATGAQEQGKGVGRVLMSLFGFGGGS